SHRHKYTGGAYSVLAIVSFARRNPGEGEAEMQHSLETMLVAVVFNEPSLIASSWTARMFESASSLIFVSVIEPPPPPPSLAQRFPSPATLLSDARAESQQKLSELSERLAPGKSDTEVRVGRPHEEILAVAKERSV